jgi:plastocyanin
MLVRRRYIAGSGVLSPHFFSTVNLSHPFDMRFFTRPLLLISTALSLLASGARGQATINIAVADNSYTPASVTAAPGDNIVFTYTGSRTHPTSTDGGSGNLTFTTFTMDATHTSHTVTLTAAGNYPYHCQFHGAPGTGMHGTIVVQPLGIRPEALLAPALEAFPNPVSAARDERVTVSFNQRVGTDGKLRLLNVIGRTVREMPIGRAAETGEAHLTLDVADLPAGVYFTSLVLGERVVETRRLIVQP